MTKEREDTNTEAPLTDDPFGYAIRADRHLRRPRLERERYSGCVNLSARKRNAAVMVEARKVYVIDSLRLIVVPSWLHAEFVAKLEAALKGPT